MSPLTFLFLFKIVFVILGPYCQFFPKGSWDFDNVDTEPVDQFGGYFHLKMSSPIPEKWSILPLIGSFMTFNIFL